MSGGEPLSEDMESKIKRLSEDLALISGDWSKLVLLRSFVREIQEPLEKNRALDTPIIQAQAASIIHLRVRLLASEESEKRKTEALEKILKWADPLLYNARINHKCWYANGVAAPPWDSAEWNDRCNFCCFARHLFDEIGAYREAGRGKP